MISDMDLKAAIDRIARTPDGELLYRFLQRKALEVVSPSSLGGALQTHHGERIFAHRLMELMRKGIDATAGRHGSDDLPSERPLVFGRREPEPAKPRTYREWAVRNDAELNSHRERHPEFSSGLGSD